MKSLPVLDQVCCTPGAPALPTHAAEALARTFKALADPARVAIVNRLAGRETCCVCQLTEPLGLSQPTVSHHLRILREANLGEVAERRGTWTYYRLRPEAIRSVAAALVA